MPSASVQPWDPKVERRRHPFGEAGVVNSLEEVAKRAATGALSPRVRLWAIECLDRARQEQGLKMNTDRERAEALLAACQKKLWVPDPVGSEWMAGSHLMACDPKKDGVCFRGGDCFPSGTLVLAEGHETIPVEGLKPGMKIWGLNRWSSVEAVEYKGVLPIDVITLNNGSEVKLTSDHHVYVLDCKEHQMLNNEEDAKTLPEDRHWRGGGADRRWGCSCHAEQRVEKRCRVSELREGMILTTPDRIPFGTESLDPDVALIEGLFISDGWADYTKNSHFCISGQDGCPKEEQKREVQEACKRLGVPTSWQRKYIRIRDRDWTLRVQQMGRYAPEKHVLSINLDEAAAASTLRGIMADSGKNTKGSSRTFTTTSRTLAIQTRLLHKMFGISCGWRYIENHGGLGENPIYRLGQRGRDTGRKPWALRVKSIDRGLLSVPCWDIQTDDHRVYLAEHDVTVSQCDDLVVLLASCFCSVGIYTLIVGHAYNRARDISHVLTAAWVNGRWMYADPSTSQPLGRCVDFTRERIYSVPNVQMLCDEHSCLVNPRRFQPEKSGFVARGEFVGVNGPPVVQFSWVVDPERSVQWLGDGDLGISTDFNIDPNLLNAGRGAAEGDWGTAGSGAATAACVATGAGAAVAPVCAVVGRFLGESFGKALNAVQRGYEQQKNELNVQDAVRTYATELMFLRDQATQKMIAELVLFARQNGWRDATEGDIASQLFQIGANITNTDWAQAMGRERPTLGSARINNAGVKVYNQFWGQRPPNTGIADLGIATGGPYYSGPVGESCPATGMSISGNVAWANCMADATRDWAHKMEVASLTVGANIVAQGGNPEAASEMETVLGSVARVQMQPKKKKKSRLLPIAATAAALGTVVWLLL